MLSAARLVLVTGLFLVGCQSASDVAVKTFRVLDAPANYVRHKIDPETTTTTTTAQTSDVANPGRPVAAPTPTPPAHSSTQRHAEASPSAHPRNPSSTTQGKPVPSGSPRSTAGQTAQFPTAKPVPGKPGYVYSVDPKGGIVDVTGYKSGDKAKDPYTQQIFIVP